MFRLFCLKSHIIGWLCNDVLLWIVELSFVGFSTASPDLHTTRDIQTSGIHTHTYIQTDECTYIQIRRDMRGGACTHAVFLMGALYHSGTSPSCGSEKECDVIYLEIYVAPVRKESLIITVGCWCPTADTFFTPPVVFLRVGETVS